MFAVVPMILLMAAAACAQPLPADIELVQPSFGPASLPGVAASWSGARGSVPDADQADADGDDADGDADGVGDACDTCMTTFNPDQTDTGGDGEGDACNLCPLAASTENGDQDGDGFGDGGGACAHARGAVGLGLVAGVLTRTRRRSDGR